MIRIPRLLAIPLVASVICGCTNTIGPRSLSSGHPSYNDAVQESGGAQLLKNIVRLRYDETPLFLTIRQINASYENEVGLNAGLSTGKPFQASTGNVADHHVSTWAFGARWQLNERPTITYAPLVGQQFADEYLTPISQETLLKLYFSGWPIAHILRLCVQEMKGLRNAPGASGPTPARAPDFERFRNVCDALQAMQDRGLLSMTLGRSQAEPVAILEMQADPSEQRLDAELRRMLDLPEGTSRVVLTRRIATTADEVTITPRTVMGVLFYLSQGVDVASEDIARKRVVVTCDGDGNTFDWQQVLGGVFSVAVGDAPPADAVVATRRGRQWHWIPADDIASKRTFHFVNQLITLSGGKFESPAPILTMPVR